MIRSLRNTLIYFGIGALCHAVFVGSHFDSRSLLSWGWLCAWPIALFVTGFFILLGLGLTIVVLVALVAIVAESELSRCFSRK